jgi:hypothetical protein
MLSSIAFKEKLPKFSTFRKFLKYFHLIFFYAGCLANLFDDVIYTW